MLAFQRLLVAVVTGIMVPKAMAWARRPVHIQPHHSRHCGDRIRVREPRQSANPQNPPAA